MISNYTKVYHAMNQYVLGMLGHDVENFRLRFSSGSFVMRKLLYRNKSARKSVGYSNIKLQTIHGLTLYKTSYLVLCHCTIYFSVAVTELVENKLDNPHMALSVTLTAKCKICVLLLG